MPRHMSFSMTTEAVRNREKTVTRRLGWWNLEPGTLLWAVEKGMGLKKGEKVKKICLIRVVDTDCESVGDIADEDAITGYCRGWSEVRREGFPELTPLEFVEMFCRANRCHEDDPVNRIEFEYVEDGGE
jgi:hypothetical protein